MELPQIDRANMGEIKSFLSFVVSVVVMEVMSIILVVVKLGATKRPLILVLISDLAFAIFARYILNNYFAVRSVISGVKLALFLTLFYTCVVGQGPLELIEKKVFSMVYTLNIFCILSSGLAVQALFKRGHYY